MTNDRRQEDFAQRLSRISRERGGTGEVDQGGPERDMSDFDYNAPRERHPVRNGIIWVVILASLGAGGYFGWNALPQDLKDMVTGIVASDIDTAEGGLSPETILETETMSVQGLTLASPAVVQAGTDILSLTDIAANVSLPTENTVIGEIIPIVRNAQCSLRTPQASEKIVGARVENALLPAPLYAFSDQQLADQLLANVEAVTQGGAGFADEMALSGTKTVLDVFVTDTTAPLYLVLQNMGPGVVWNLHAAPEVQIAHVAIIGADFSGVANLPAGTTVEGLLVSDFVPPHQYGADDTPRDCMIRPWRNPRPEWIGSLRSEAGSLADQNQMYSYAKGYEAYNRWYTGALGVNADTNTVSVRDAAHVLLGPQPVEPIAYQSVAGNALHLMESDYLLTGDAATRKTTATELHESLLSAAIGGGLSALDPPAVERGSQ